MPTNFMRMIQKARKGEQFPLVVTLVIIFTLMSIANGHKFLSFGNISAMAYQLPIIGLLAIGMMIAELSGGINLSLVANTNFNGIVIYLVLAGITHGNMGSANGFQILIAIIVGFISSIVIGLCNGLMIARLRIPAILATLGTASLLQGVSLVLTEGYTISGFPKTLTFIGNGTVIGIPMPLILFIAVIVLTHFILNRSVFGKQLYLTGANQVAARYSNVNTTRIVILEYILSACFASFCSLIIIGQMNSVKANYYESYLLIAVLASFLGGVDPNGGFGKLSGMVIASVILQMISTGLNLMRLDPFMVTATWGAIIILVLFGKELFGKMHKKPGAKRILSDSFPAKG